MQDDETTGLVPVGRAHDRATDQPLNNPDERRKELSGGPRKGRRIRKRVSRPEEDSEDDEQVDEVVIEDETAQGQNREVGALTVGESSSTQISDSVQEAGAVTLDETSATHTRDSVVWIQTLSGLITQNALKHIPALIM